MDVVHGIHGRALPIAQGLKLAAPERHVLVFTGDGDCLAIGGNHLIHAANRNIDLTVLMVNNYIYGMTGGQKSPATPKNMVTKTSPYGTTDISVDGCRLAIVMGASYVARWTTAHPLELEKSIARGIRHKGFSFIEILAQCPVQVGREVFGTKDAGEIMSSYKERARSGEIEIGVFKDLSDIPEYTERAPRSEEEAR
jgi:2-oxoglutarate ferredoxin oxidoreductase subunit beta